MQTVKPLGAARRGGIHECRQTGVYLEDADAALAVAEISNRSALLAVDRRGAEDVKEMETLLDETVYAVKFRFSAGMMPGYVGDYFILVGDALGEPVQLIRQDDGVLAFL
jgi:hypothetical protein